MNRIGERIERQLGIPGLASLLAERVSPNVSSLAGLAAKDCAPSFELTVLVSFSSPEISKWHQRNSDWFPCTP